MIRKFYLVILIFLSPLDKTIFGLQNEASENITETLESPSISNGFGESYSWYTLEDGLSKAKGEGKPLMIIIHKPNCGACEAFKGKFSASEYILKLSEYFIMVNIKEQDTEEEKFSPDGTYIPRILFLDRSGSAQLDIYNKHGNPGYKYFYHNMFHLAESMKKAISKMVTFSAYDEL